MPTAVQRGASSQTAAAKGSGRSYGMKCPVLRNSNVNGFAETRLAFSNTR